MNDEQLDQLVKLDQVNPELAQMVAEYQRLSEATKNQYCKDWLQLMVGGWLSVVDEDPDAWMSPIVLPGGKPYLGYGNVQDISTTEVTYADGSKQIFSVWFSRSFAHRLQFLAKGQLAVGYTGGVAPLCLMLNPGELGIKIVDA